MPMYTFVDQNTDKQLDVLRSMDDRDTPPTVEEALEDAEFTEEEAKAADWKRVIPGGIRVTYKQGSLKGRM